MILNSMMMSLRFILLWVSLALAASKESIDEDGSDPFGGASWEFENSVCKIKWPDASQYPDLEVKDVENPKLLLLKQVIGNASEAIPSDRTIANYINTFKPAYEAIDARLNTLFVKTKLGFVEGRLKDVKSIKNNILKNNKSLSSFNDIIGFRVTTRTVTHVLQAMHTIINDTVNFKVKKAVKCYGVCPGSGKYRPDNGYRRVHIIVEVKGKPAELQLSTPYMTLFADYSHDLIYKGPVSIATNPQAKNYTLQLADYYYNLDEVRDKLPPCPTILEKADLEQILQSSLGLVQGKAVYKKLGEPPNACQWWNDLVVNHLTSDTCPAKTSLAMRLRGFSSLWAAAIFTVLFVIERDP